MIQFVSRAESGEYDHDATARWARSHCRWIADQLQTDVVDTVSSDVKAGPVAIVCDFWDTAFVVGSLVYCQAVKARPCLFIRRSGTFKALLPTVRALKAIHAICTPATHPWRLWTEEWIAQDRSCFFQTDWQVEAYQPQHAAVYVGCPQAVGRANRIWTFLNDLSYPDLVICGTKQVSVSTGNYPYRMAWKDIGLRWDQSWRYFALGKVVVVVQDAQDGFCMTPDSRIWHAWQAGRPVVFDDQLWRSRQDVWKRWEGNNGQIKNRKRAFFPYEEFQKWTVGSAADLHRIVESLPNDHESLKAVAETQKAALAPYYFLNNRNENNVVEYFRCA